MLTALVGSWFKDEELFKRTGVWFMGNSLGFMFSGYMQAAIYRSLNGVNGYAGWQWQFLVQGIITLPVAFIGFAVWPGLPTSPKRWYLTADEHALAVKRIPVVEKEGITWKTFKYALGRPMWWICVPTYMYVPPFFFPSFFCLFSLTLYDSFLIQGNYWTSYMSLWLESAGYSVEMRTILPTFIDLLRVLSSWIGTTLAGCLSLRGLWTFQFSFCFFALVVLNIWHVPTALKFVAFYFGGFPGMASPILFAWVNATLKDNYGERGFIISSMMTLGFTCQIWIPLLTFPTVEAPRFPHGYPASITFEVLAWAMLMFGASFMKRWKFRRGDVETITTATRSGDDEETDEKDKVGGDDEKVVVAGDDKREPVNTVRPAPEI